jgi:hypothetical protein
LRNSLVRQGGGAGAGVGLKRREHVLGGGEIRGNCAHQHLRALEKSVQRCGAKGASAFLRRLIDEACCVGKLHVQNQFVRAGRVVAEQRHNRQASMRENDIG